MAEISLPSDAFWGTSKRAITTTDNGHIYITASRFNGVTYYVALYRSTDGGSTWTLIKDQISSSGSVSLPYAVHSYGNSVYVGCTSSSGYVNIGKYDGDTGIWTQLLTNSSLITDVSSIDILVYGQQIYFACASGSGTGIRCRVLYSDNGGGTWTTYAPSVNMAGAPNIARGSDGWVYVAYLQYGNSTTADPLVYCAKRDQSTGTWSVTKTDIDYGGVNHFTVGVPSITVSSDNKVVIVATSDQDSSTGSTVPKITISTDHASTWSVPVEIIASQTWSNSIAVPLASDNAGNIYMLLQSPLNTTSNPNGINGKCVVYKYDFNTWTEFLTLQETSTTTYIYSVFGAMEREVKLSRLSILYVKYAASGQTRNMIYNYFMFSFSKIKRWNGSAWVSDVKAVRVWNGSAWVASKPKRWDGSNNVTVK
ncbi:sialidase family protein [Paenibacillus harenae]|uniref:sialidase family protein n=1 Tax=Paenibacillus harenae TaxID=306543 RepID=UPI002790CECD|nr:sialidase family protein [Paenibacillus harenae]MDQ0063566.1 hypothetical protein [Paenibacillus harenae]